MRAVIQRVSKASVETGGRLVGEIGRGILLLVGVGAGDTMEDVDCILKKTLELRIFPDEGGKMNRSVVDAGGALLIVSQFTLYGDARKGRRPSYSDAMPPAEAAALYESMVEVARRGPIPVATGEFQAMMDVSLVNDGPVTLLLDSRRQF